MTERQQLRGKSGEISFNLPRLPPGGGCPGCQLGLEGQVIGRAGATWHLWCWLEQLERELWNTFLETGADPSDYTHETRTAEGQEVGFQDFRKRMMLGDVKFAVQDLRDD